MRIQKIPFSKTEHPEMYFRGGETDGTAISLRGGEAVSFDTYFGCFSYPKYRDYTVLTDISVRIALCGSARVRLCSFDGKETSTLCETSCDGTEATLRAELGGLPECGILYPVIEAITDVRITAAEYFTDAAAPSDISCAIAICTYRREDALRANLAALSSHPFSHIRRVMVVDNGNTLKKEETESGLIRLYPNKNYGGSAGFTRGIIEALREGMSHVILMDDDVVLYPEALERMTVMASLLRDEYRRAHISAAMLRASTPYIQHELGAAFDGRIRSLRAGLDVRQPESLIENMRGEAAAYGAWWCFLMPLSDVSMHGLPLPLFIKFDDVEYGMRTCADAGAPIIVLNGTTVMHEDFDRKYSMHLEYYGIRNQLITQILRNRRGRSAAISRLIKSVTKHLFLYRYDALDTVLAAFGDILLGAEHLMSCDAEELNRRLMSGAPKAIPLSDIPEWQDGMRERKRERLSTPARLISVLTLGGHLIPRFLLKKDAAAFPLPDAPLSSAFMHRVTVQYQLGSDSGYRLERSFGKFLRYSARAVGMAFRILLRYGKAKRSFIENEKRLCSEDFWCEYLGIPKSGEKS